MRNLLLITCLLPGLLCAQVLEDFETTGINDWVQSSHGHWKADSILALSGRYSLHHIFDNTEAGQDMIGIKLSDLRPELGNVGWEFQIKHGFAPSSSNNWGVFLTSDNSPEEMKPGADVSGFVIGVNMQGSDDTLRLWKIDRGQLSVLAATCINWQNDIGIDSSAIIRTERTSAGSWSIMLRDSEGKLTNIARASDPTLFNINWFGVLYEYTSTKDRLIWFDNIRIEGIFLSDTQAPSINDISFSGGQSIKIEFSEQLSSETLENSNFKIKPGDYIPYLANKQENNYLKLYFEEVFINKTTYIIEISDLCDQSHNCTGPINREIVFAYPEWGDIIFSELMVDPNPQVKLPEKEYLELFNAGDFDFNLLSCNLLKGSSSTQLKNYSLDRGEYLILCDESDSLIFSEYSSVMSLSSFPQLKNSGDLILLKDTAGNTIHGIEYSDSWYNNQLKEEGGWSLEIIDTEYPFSGSSNWSASKSKEGGTPGNSNSVSSRNPDLDNPYIKNVFPIDSNTVSVSFSEPARQGWLLAETFSLDRAEVYEIIPLDPLYRDYYLNTTELIKGHIYRLNVSEEMTDEAGNSLLKSFYEFGIPLEPGYNDLIINELLFDPLPWEEDYLELYNRSDKVLDVASFLIITVNSETGDTGKLALISEEGRCILPGDHFAISVAGDRLTEIYPSGDPDYIFEPVSMPVMPDEEGILILCQRDLTIIDRMHYNENMHFDLISNKEGISLERIDPDKPAFDYTNWHSASGTSGWGTPGTKNSVSLPGASITPGINLSSRKISPDNDGFEDILAIRLLYNSKNQVITVNIYDDQGFMVRTLAKNITTDSDATLYWDGTDSGGSIVREGIYIIFVKSTNPSGSISSWKKVCTVIRRN